MQYVIAQDHEGRQRERAKQHADCGRQPDPKVIDAADRYSQAEQDGKEVRWFRHFAHRYRGIALHRLTKMPDCHPVATIHVVDSTISRRSIQAIYQKTYSGRLDPLTSAYYPGCLKLPALRNEENECLVSLDQT
jgi:hypothetical protein